MATKQNPGKLFEQQFLKSVPEDYFKLRIKDDTMHFAKVNNPMDILLFHKGRLYALELKSTQQASLPFGNIHEHQFNDLLTLSSIEGIHSGFVIEMRKYEETYFLDIKNAIAYKENSGRKSFDIAFLRETGIKIPQTKKRVRFTFDVEHMINSIVAK